jgi:hypothetical protein
VPACLNCQRNFEAGASSSRLTPTHATEVAMGKAMSHTIPAALVLRADKLVE